MTEDEYVDAIADLWPDSGDASAELMTLSEEALSAYPNSVCLWNLRGNVIQIEPDDAPGDLEDALSCYERAVGLDPSYMPGWESIGFYVDIFHDDQKGAEQAFRRAISLGGPPYSDAGLARVLREQGKTIDEAIRVLSEAECPFHDDAKVVEIRQEILDGQWGPCE